MKIKSIEAVKPRKVYAIRTSTGTFIADGLAHHNCYGCNVGMGGAYVAYTLLMVKKYGDEWVRGKMELKNKTKKYTVNDLIEIRTKYEQKYQDLIFNI